jgi:PAS domain-containing protein
VHDRGTAQAQQPLQLILARNLISTLSTAAFLVDASGTIVFYNDAAGDFLGMRYEETGRVSLDDWRAAIAPAGPADEQVEGPDLPISVALREHRPSHTVNHIRAADGSRAAVEVLVLPLISAPDQREGAIGVFWPHEDE